MTALDLSVIIPHYNRHNMIPNAINSVLRQTLPATEIIIVDDGSTTSSRSTLEQFLSEITASNVRLIYNSINHGVSYSRNVGIAHAQCAWISFLDSDDTWTESHNQHLCALIDEFPDTSFAFGDCRFVGSRPGPENAATSFSRRSIQHLIAPNGPNDSMPVTRAFLQQNLRGSYVSSSSTIVRKSALQCIGCFDEALSFGEDCKCWISLIARYNSVMTTHILSEVNLHGGNSTHPSLSAQITIGDLDRVLSQLEDAATLRLNLDEIQVLQSVYAECLSQLRHHMQISDIPRYRHYAAKSKYKTGRLSIRDLARAIRNSVMTI